MTVTQFIRILFRDSKSYKNINEKDKSKMFFMFNRIISRLYPPNANALNYNGIDTSLACDVWFETLSPRFRDIPNQLSPNWNKLKKKSDSNILNGFSDTDKKILLEYEDLIKEAEVLEKERKKIEKEGTIKVTKKRQRKNGK